MVKIISNATNQTKYDQDNEQRKLDDIDFFLYSG